MRPPDELDDVDWAGHEHGWAVPPLVRMLYADYPDFDRNGFGGLKSHLCDLGLARRRSTVLSVPFLAHAALHSEFFPGQALSVLSRFADADDGARDPGLEVREAVAGEAAGLLPCLEFADPGLRQFALQVLGGCAHSLGTDDQARVTAAVLHVFEHDLDRDVSADALTLLLLLGDESACAPLVDSALGSADPVIRLTGLLCALEAGYLQDPAERAAAVEEAGKLAARHPGGHFGFPVVGTRQDRARRAFRALQTVYRDGV